MKNILLLLILLLISINCTGQQLKNTIVLPVEVFGKNGATESISLNLNGDPSAARGLKLQIHGLSYTNKASVKINNSQWYDVNNRTNNIYFLNPYVRASQGISQNLQFPGIFSTYDFVVLIPAINFYTTNTVTFRFNDLNGLSVGFRVLDISIVDLNYNELPLYTKKVQDDPSKWIPFSTNIANINNGSNKWFYGVIKHNGTPIRATCNDCHVDEAYDLKYFNYSNKSIVLRSTALHSLSLQDSQDIASFIRTRNIPYEPDARPWNPPYQPGPELDSKPVRSWAAGAGLQWVLTNDYDTITNIFPFGTSTNLVNYGTNGLKPFDPSKYTLNAREIPMVIPLPDWNRWLPNFHPLDIYPTVITNNNSQFLGKYLQAYASIKNAGNKYDQLRAFNRGLDKVYYDYLQRVQHNVNIDYQGQPAYFYPPPSSTDWVMGNLSILKWILVKNFEFMKTFELEELGNITDGDYNQWGAGITPSTVWSDKRRWFFNRVFFMAPHVTAVPETYAQWGGESASWYQLAQILNSGNRYSWDQVPVDQGYLAAFGDQFLPYKIPISRRWYPNWTERSYGIVMINTIKLLENSERGSNYPAPYVWPVYYLGYNPNGHLFSIAQTVGEQVLWGQINPQLQIGWLSIWANKFYDLVVRYTSQQWAGGANSGDTYNGLLQAQKALEYMKTKGINITDDTIMKVKAARNHIRPNLE